MRLSIVGRFRTFNTFPWALCAILVIHALCPSTAEANKKRRKLLKPVVVRDVYVDVRNIFDPTVPGEDIWLFRLANRLHIETRAAVIRRELLMRPGDQTDTEQIDESERNLRALPFIKDAVVMSQPNSDGTVDLHVRTQDSWTTQPQFDVSSEGGQSTYSAGFEEINLLGYGKDVSYFYKKNVDGVTHQVGYNDPQFLNTRLHLSSAFQDTPSGNVQDVKLEQPFYSFTTRSAYGVSVDHSNALQKVFLAGNQISQYDQDHLNLSPYIGKWVNNDPLNAIRVTLTYRYAEDVFQAQDVTLPGTLPAAKALSGPIVGTSFTQSDFIKDTFVDKAGRVEDINLGHQANAGLGYVGRKLGATENSLPFSANEAVGFGGDGPWFGLMSLGTSSRYNLYSDGQTGGRLFNTIYFLNLNYYQHADVHFPMITVAHAASAYLQRPDASNVLAIGGDSGLRAFKTNAFTGNKSLLLNLEERAYYPQEVLHLAYVGGAVFVDAGQVQPQGLGFTTKDFHVNLGAGMRFGLSRSADGTVFRIDLAYAVGPIQQSNRWILSVSTSPGFTREANTYKNFASPTTTQ
jgi:hemolysin activation/secretion protein